MDAKVASVGSPVAHPTVPCEGPSVQPPTDQLAYSHRVEGTDDQRLERVADLRRRT